VHYLLIYDTAPDYLERRGEFRDAHLALAWQAVDRGELLLGGATSNPPDGAVLLFEAGSPDVPTAFAKADPYVLNGIVTGWQVKAWNTVVGAQASTPVRPTASPAR
jgi:uncharacterized protein YciI